jgi:hypothetical protein
VTGAYHRQGWLAAGALALAWGVGPLLPALVRGDIPGSPATDLFPALWGLGWFADHAGEGLPTWAPELAAPQGMPFYYSSPLHGWLAAATRPVSGLVGAYVTGVIAARIATVLCAFGAGRALRLGPEGALLLAAVYGCAPFFHGYTVEGIIEGTDGWTLPLWIWLAARGRWLAAALAAALVVLSSWYMALTGLLVAVAVAPLSWRATVSFASGLAMASPALSAFLGAFPAGTPLEPAVRAAMGASLDPFPRPGTLPGVYPYAKTTWLGWIAPALALIEARRSPRLAAATLTFWALSLGMGPLYDLPIWRAIRFPYRLHAATLLGVGLLAGFTVDRSSRRGRSLVAVAVVAEGLLLSPIEPVVPGCSPVVPDAILSLRGKNVLAVPGPVAMAPGVINRSRLRSRYLLYEAAVAGTRTPWAPDFNAVGAVGTEPPVLGAVRSWDPLVDRPRIPFAGSELAQVGIDVAVLHPRDLGPDVAATLRDALIAGGATILHEDSELIVVGGW